MKLFLIRHTAAIEHETKTVTSDDLRFISRAGRMVARNVFGSLKKRMSGIEQIFTSPLIRAVQTAEILATMIEFNGDIDLVNELRNESSISSIISLLEKHSEYNEVALIGHEPKMSILLSTLCGSTSGIDGFSKCGVALLDYSPKIHTGKFVGYFDPKRLNVLK